MSAAGHHADRGLRLDPDPQAALRARAIERLGPRYCLHPANRPRRVPRDVDSLSAFKRRMRWRA